MHVCKHVCVLFVMPSTKTSRVVWKSSRALCLECCSALQCVALREFSQVGSVVERVAVCCSVLQCEISHEWALEL